jgi:hypothetical protein
MTNPAEPREPPAAQSPAPVSPQPYSKPPEHRGFWSTGLGTFSIIAIVFWTMIVTCVGLGVLRAVIQRANAAKMAAQVTGCTFSARGLFPSATVEFTVTNHGDKAHGATVDIEYRDAAGQRVDTDTSFVRTVPAGATVRRQETTLLNEHVSAVTCHITGVR